MFLVLASTAPLNVSATAISATSIRLNWNQPASFNGILHDYKVRYKLSSDAVYVSPFGIGKQLNYIVDNLKPYANYELQVNVVTLALVQYCLIMTISSFKSFLR